MRETTKKLARKRHSLLGKKKRKKGERATSPSSVSTCTHLTIWAAKETGRFTPQHRIGRKLLAAASVIHPCPLLLLLRLLWRSIFHRPEEETFSASVTCHHMTLGRFSSYFFKYLCLCCPHLLPRTKKSDIGLVLWGGKKSPPRFFRHFCAPPI